MNRRNFVKTVGMTALAVTTPLVQAQSDTSTWTRITQTKRLRAGVVQGGIPYYQKDLVTGEWRGCMTDFYRLLASSVGAQLDLHETTWGNSVLDLQADKIDLFFGLNPTPVRKRAIDFTVPVLNIAYTIITKTPARFATWQDLDSPNVTIAVDTGSSHDQLATQRLTKANIMRLPSATEASLAVQSGRADAQILVLPLALSLASKNPSNGVMVVPKPAEYATSNGGLRKQSDDRWAQHVDAWIERAHRSGQLKEIFLKNLKEVGGVNPAMIPMDLKL